MDSLGDLREARSLLRLKVGSRRGGMASDTVEFLKEQSALQSGIEGGCLDSRQAAFGGQGTAKAEKRGGHHAEVVG